MDSSWIIAVGILGGVGAWAYSQKSDSPDESGESTTELQNSDKPAFSSLQRTNPERYSGWKKWVNTFDTTCGWTPEEEYCPNAIINNSGCSVDCTRPFYQMSEEQRKIAVLGAGGWSPWTEDVSNCQQFTGVANLCLWPFPMETIDPSGCDPIRIRAKFPDPVLTTGKFTVDIQMQVLGLLDTWKRCDPNLPVYLFTSEQSIGRNNMITIDNVFLSGRDNKTLAEYQIDNTVEPTNLLIDNISNWSSRGETILGQYNFSDECYCGVYDGGTDAHCDLDKEYDNSVTTQSFDVDVGNLNDDNFYSGWYDLTIQINVGREIDGSVYIPGYGESVQILPEWAEGCEFETTVTLTVPNFVFVYSKESCDSCTGEVLIDNFCQCFCHSCWGWCNDDKDCDIRAKYNYMALSSGTLERRNAYTDAPTSSKCSTGGIICTDESKDEYNAESIFPRNGFMIW